MMLSINLINSLPHPHKRMSFTFWHHRVTSDGSILWFILLISQSGATWIMIAFLVIHRLIAAVVKITTQFGRHLRLQLAYIASPSNLIWFLSKRWLGMHDWIFIGTTHRTSRESIVKFLRSFRDSYEKPYFNPLVWLVLHIRPEC